MQGSELAHGGEVVVTAQKRQQGANDVGITMNVFTGELVKGLGISVAEGLAKFTAGGSGAFDTRLSDAILAYALPE